MSFKLEVKDRVPRAEKLKAPYKAKLANKYIGFGKRGSSTYYYATQAKKQGIPVNDDNYSTDDVVFVSVNGRPTDDDLKQTYDYCKKALDSGAKILTDSERYLRVSKYNQGEKKLRELLLNDGYVVFDTSNEHTCIWRKKS